MGLETGSFIEDLDIANPAASDSRTQGDDHLRLIKTLVKATFPGMTGAAWRVQTKATGYTVVAGDNMSIFSCAAAITLALTAVATIGNKFACVVYANGADVVIDPNGTETINGGTSLTLTNGQAALLVCTGALWFAFGLPLPNLGTIGQSLGASTIELGHASDTTLARVSAGVMSVEGKAVMLSAPRVGSTTSSATPTINTDNIDIYKLTAQAVDITSFTTNLSGTPSDGQVLIIQITGTAARAITWGASFEASTVALPTTTVTTAMLSVGFLWNAVTSKWRCMAAV